MHIDVQAEAPVRLAGTASDAVLALLAARGALVGCTVPAPRDGVLELAAARLLEALRWAAEQAVARAEELEDDLRAAQATYDAVEERVRAAAGR